MFHLRSNNKYLLSPASVKTRLSDKAFEAAAPKLWNDLPHDIRNTGGHLNKIWKEYFLNELINRKLLFLHFILYFISIL